MANIRIKDQTTDTALAAGDYIIVDNATEGTRKFDLGTALSNLNNSLVDIHVEGTALVINTGLIDGNEVSY